MSRVFVSHSSRDKDLAPWFDTIFAREKVEAVRFEFEYEARQKDPIAELILRVQTSVAMFVLLSPETTSGGTMHTGNWMCAEVGMARGLGKPVWVFERLSKPIDFPVPFVDHFVRLPDNGPEDIEYFQFLRSVISGYGTPEPPVEPWLRAGRLQCSRQDCQATFQIHQSNHDFGRCPVCCTRGKWDMAGMTCPECNGTGSVFATLRRASPCGNCQGNGGFLVNMGAKPCQACDGKGFLSQGGTTGAVCVTCKGTGSSLWTYWNTQVVTQ
jgi:hypothetical protein